MELTLTWLGGPTVRLRGPFGTAVCEPEGEPPPGADIVTRAVSPPPSEGPEVGGGDGPCIIEGPGEYEMRGVFVVGVPTPGPSGVPFSTTYALTVGDVTICHLGRAVARPRDEDAADLGAIDVLVVPLGGPEALDAAKAAEVVGELAPRIVVPVLVGDGGALGQLLAELGHAPVEPVDALRVQPGPPSDDVEVVLLRAESPAA